MTIVQQSLREDRVSIDTTWEGYLKVLEVIGDGSTRVTYERGRLELMSPSERHEALKTILGALIECIIDEGGLECHGAGSMTFKQQDLDRGLEPDECYWIQHFVEVRGVGYEPAVSPPPDLVVEVDVSRGSIERRSIYAAMGFPELWIVDASATLRVLRLSLSGTFEPVDPSPTFPWVSIDEVQAWLRTGLEAGQMAAVRGLRQWLRAHAGGVCPRSA